MGFLSKVFWCWLLRKHRPTYLMGDPKRVKYCVDCEKPLDENNKSIKKGGEL